MKPSRAVQTLNIGRGRLVNRLPNSGSGRVALHFLCLFRNPRRLRWHWRGIARELYHIADRSGVEPALTQATKGALA